MIGRARTLLRLFTKGELGDIRRTLALHWYSTHEAYGLRRDLREPVTPPPSRIPVTVRRATENDVARILASRAGSPASRVELVERQGLVRRHPGGCWVAVDSEGEPAYVQWLFDWRDNDLVQSHFKTLFPPLGRDEALLENAYTFERFRGLGVMSHAMTLIADAARAGGCRWAKTYVGRKNLPSLKGCLRAGFQLATTFDHRWRAFRIHVQSRPLSAAEIAQVLGELSLGARSAG